MISTREVNPEYASNGEFWCMFLAPRCEDVKKSHELSRWWSEWYRYTKCQYTDVIMYCDRVHIRPSTNPCSSKLIQWSTLLPLFGYKAVTLVGPFQFESISVSNRVRQKVYHDHWIQLAEACKSQGILPTTMGTRNSHKHSKIQDKGVRKSKRKR